MLSTVWNGQWTRKLLGESFKLLARETKFLYGQGDGNILGKTIEYFYSLPPYNSAELESIFKETKFDPAWAREILDEVRKAVKEYPDDGFRIWQSVDALFRVDAKFISINDKMKPS